MDKSAHFMVNSRADNCSEPMDNYVMNHKCTTNTRGGTPGLSHNKLHTQDLKQAMQTMPRSLIKLLLVSTFMLACAGSALAQRTIYVDYVTVTMSSLTNAPTFITPADNIVVRNGGTLYVDVGATVGSVTIGDATTAGNVVFTGTSALTLTVANDVALGPNPNNLLNMTLSTAHTIQVGGNFLASGAGTFQAGAATIEYNSPNNTQAVTAQIGGTGATIQYKNLTLSGINPSYPTNSAVKLFANGVSVQGTLTIKQEAVPSGGSVYYGTLAALAYSGSVAQMTTTTEWPAAPSVLNVAVTILNPQGVTLDSDKNIAAIAPYSLNVQAGNLYDNGHTLTVAGNIQNYNALVGPGKLVLGGTSAQTLAGNGIYGNVTLFNNATSALPSSSFTPNEPVIQGRLTIMSGSKLTLPNGTAHQASLLTYGGSDQLAGTYGSSVSGATTKNDTVFDNTANGILTVNPKPTPIVSESYTGQDPGGWATTYGTASFYVAGTVTPPPTPVNFSMYGNGALSGEVISNVVYSGSNPIQTNLTTVGSSGAYSVTLNTATLAIGSYTVTSSYMGGINLSAANSIAQTLTVNPRPIGVLPNSGQSKIYGDNDPVFGYAVIGSLVSNDAFTGALSRASGANVGTYAILPGTLALSANYTIYFTNGILFTILPKGISVTMISTNKVYGSSDPPFNRSNIDYTISPQLVSGDAMSGALGRAAGQTVGSYALSLGTLTAGGNGGANYRLTAANSAYLTINVLPVTVNFGTYSKTYGDADPQFTYTFSPTPLPYGDSFTSTYSTNRDAGQTVAGSPYIIRPGTATGAGNVAIAGDGTNYSLNFSTSGKLTINAKQVTVTALSPTMVYGAQVPAEVQYSGFITSPQNGVPGQNAPQTPATTTPATPVTSCSPPVKANYPFVISTPGSDPNYTLQLGGTQSGTVTVTPAPLLITAQNQSKVFDGNPFPTNNYPVNYYNMVLNANGFICSDTATVGSASTNAFSSGTLAFTGTGTTATNVGVYPIMPTGLQSTKYGITYVPGWVTITALPGATTNTGSETWAGPAGAVGNPAALTSTAWMINNANAGTVGANPGWTLHKINGTLTIIANSEDQFRVDMVTLAGNAVGSMAKFDPTRPYSWEFVRTANGIAGFNANAFNLNWQAVANQGVNLFQNPVFNGIFTITQTGNSLFLNFTPMGSTGGFAAGGGYNVPIPSGYDVGTSLSDTSKLLGYIYNSDVPELWLTPSGTTVSPQSPLTVYLNVGNLQGQPIIGVDAYINFNSRVFDASTGTASSPQVVAGGGVWNNVIVKTWNVGGDLDTVVALSLNSSGGTTADGTVAQITLTPTRTFVGTSRVVFRADGGPNAGGTGAIVTDLVPLSGTPMLPGRVMTDEITVTGAGVNPVIGAITATQWQPTPTYGTNVNVNVLNGTAAAGTQTIRTSGGISATTSSGPVVITVTATDAGGVGLNGPPTLVLNNGASQVTLPCTTPGATGGPFVYQWTVLGSIANGTWTATVTATDTIGNSTTVANAFTLVVNTTEVTGVVDVQSFNGTNRTVTFMSGGVAGGAGSNQWNLNLNFISGPILNAGAFQDTANMAAQINNPADSVSTWLSYGTILNLPALANSLSNQRGGVSTYIYQLLYGTIGNLLTIAHQLSPPTRNIDVYIDQQLSPATLAAMATYLANQTTANAAVFQKYLLNDFNTIVLYSPNIWDPIRFAGVTSVEPSGTDIQINRQLLADAYPVYVPGMLSPQTAQALFNYPGTGDDPALAADILADFATLTVSPNMWPVPIHQYDQGLYNQTVFLGVTLSPTTETMLQTPQTGYQLILLNQYLLQDAYAGQIQKAPLAPATVAAAQAFNASNPSTVQAFTTAITTDLNSLILSGTNIYYTDNVWASFANAIASNPELVALLAVPSPTPAQLVRMNRLLFETAYSEELTESELATFRLVQVPPAATQISAKTAWNLRVTQNVAFPSGVATLNFVSDGVPGWSGATDTYLRGGDINGDNVINLLDYDVLRTNYGTVNGGPADINGDGKVNIYDYSLLEVNFGQTGAPQVTN